MSPAPNELSATEAARLIAGGDLTSEALVATCLARIEAREGAVQAWTFLDPEQALATLRHAAKLGPDAILEVGVVVDGMGAMAETEHQAAGAWIDADAGAARGRLCEVRRELTGPTLLAIADAGQGTQQVIVSAEYPTAIEETDSVLVVCRVPPPADAVRYECHDPLVTGEIGNRFTIGGDAADDGAGYLGLYTANAAVRFRYAVIYGPE